MRCSLCIAGMDYLCCYLFFCFCTGSGQTIFKKNNGYIINGNDEQTNFDNEKVFLPKKTVISFIITTLKMVSQDYSFQLDTSDPSNLVLDSTIINDNIFHFILITILFQECAIKLPNIADGTDVIPV